MKKIFTLFVLSIAICGSSFGQRFLEEVFDEVTVTENVMYGVNATVILVPDTSVGEAIPQPLVMDVYEPASDTMSMRPLVIYCHTGNFLPHPQNGSATGTKSDSATVEMCTRLAKMGYVVASIDYRKGWNPIAPTQDMRVYTLINAAYRGVQDARTCIRFFRKDVDLNDNAYAIDEERIALWGQGTGGYISLAAATLDDYNKIPTATDGKFMWVPPGGDFPVPMVVEAVNGDIYGTSVGINPLDGDTLCYPNHVGYSSDFHACVNMGGALADSSWIEEGMMEMISFHSPSDPFAPYGTGTVIVPVLNLPVVEVSGSAVVQQLQSDFGNNDIFANMEFDDEWSLAANMNNNGNDGLFPFVRPDSLSADSAPWEWWSGDNPNNGAGLITNPTMSAEKGKTFCDTIQGYVAPRLMCALNLPGMPCTPVNVEDVELSGFDVYPNPANNQINLVSDEAMERLVIYNVVGAKALEISLPKVKRHTLDISSLSDGIYILQISSGDHQYAQRIVVRR